MVRQPGLRARTFDPANLDPTRFPTPPVKVDWKAEAQSFEAVVATFVWSWWGRKKTAISGQLSAKSDRRFAGGEWQLTANSQQLAGGKSQGYAARAWLVLLDGVWTAARGRCT